MVFFADKAHNGYSIDKPEQFLTERSLKRRSNQGISITNHDLPVSEFYLNELRKDPELRLFFTTKWMNGVLVEMDDGKVEEVKSNPFVFSVELVAPGSKLSNLQTGGRKNRNSETEFQSYDGLESKAQNEFIRVDEMHALGYHGEDMLLAIFDSGFKHVDQSSFYSRFMEVYLNNTRDFIRGSANVFQYDTHGSRVLSCISAYKEGIYSGIAPASDVVLCVTEDIGSEYRIEEYNWLFAAEFSDSLGVDIINSSVGYSYFDDDNMNYTYEDLDGQTTVVTRAASMAVSKGMLVISSIGNEGNNSWLYMNAPADANAILAVGAATYDQQRAKFSSFGPTSDGRIKPEISALGNWVRTVLNEDIRYDNGTSFAAPMIAGLAAGLWQAYPQLSNMELMEYLKITSSQAESPDTLLGYGIANFTKAYNKIKLTEEDLVDRFVVFPNPVDHKRYVYFYTDSMVTDKHAQISFHDLKGSFVQKLDLGVSNPNELIEVDVSFLRPGAYILTYVNERIRKKSKLVIL